MPAISPQLNNVLSFSDALSATDAQYHRQVPEGTARVPEYHATPCLAPRGRVRDAVRSSPSSVLDEYTPRLRILHSMMPSLFRMHCQRRMHNTTGKCL